MAMISLNEAAPLLGITSEEIEEWVEQGLLNVHTEANIGDLQLESMPLESRDRRVDDEELAEVAESLGWLQLSAENWEDNEEE